MEITLENNQELNALTSSSNRPPREISTRRLLGDGLGQFALNISSGLLGLITYYYTDVVGVSAAVVGTILLATKLLDAFADIGMGVLVDRTKSKYGQARPWLLWMVIPMLVSIFLLFSVPDISHTGKVVYAVLTNLFFYLCVYTPISIPYASLMALTTKSPYERSLMGIIRSSTGYLAGMIVAIGFLPIANALGGGRMEWTVLASLFGLSAAAGVLVAFFSNKEKYNMSQIQATEGVKEHLPLLVSLKLLFSNKYWVITLLITALINIIFALGVSAGTYYAKYIWGDVNLVSILGAVGLLPVIIGFAASAPAIKRFGKRNTALAAILIGLAGALFRLIAPESLMIGLIGSIFQNLGTIPLMAVMGAMTTDTIEYGEWKYGERIIGLTNSASSFGGKVGTGLGAAMIGWFLAWGGYQENAAVQGLGAKQAIIALNIYVPIIVLGLVAYLLYRFKLDQEYPQIVKELEDRKRA